MKYIFKSTLKQKLLSATAAHPRLTMLGIGMGVMMTIGTTIGFVEPSQAHAYIGFHHHWW